MLGGGTSSAHSPPCIPAQHAAILLPGTARPCSGRSQLQAEQSCSPSSGESGDTLTSSDCRTAFPIQHPQFPWGLTDWPSMAESTSPGRDTQLPRLCSRYRDQEISLSRYNPTQDQAPRGLNLEKAHRTQAQSSAHQLPGGEAYRLPWCRKRGPTPPPCSRLCAKGWMVTCSRVLGTSGCRGRPPAAVAGGTPRTCHGGRARPGGGGRQQAGAQQGSAGRPPARGSH